MQAAAPKEMPPVEFTDVNARTMHRQYVDGRRSSAPLLAGPDGFATATFGSEVVVTEVPNLLLAVKKKPAAALKKPASAMKKPAAAADDDFEHGPADGHDDDDDEEEEEEEEESSEQGEAAAKEEAGVEAIAKTYSKMWYKNYNCYGVRQNFLGKRQILSCGGKLCGKSQKQLERIVDDVIAKLERGDMSELAAKEWVKDQLRP